MPTVDAVVARVAVRQKGLVTRAQVRAAGVSSTGIDRRLASGRWIRFERGVYLVAGAPVTWRVKVMAACLATGGVASHRTVAVLRELEGFRRVPSTSPCPPGGSAAACRRACTRAATRTSSSRTASMASR